MPLSAAGGAGPKVSLSGPLAISASDNLASIQAALSEARGFDESGKEPERMDAIARAKRLAG